MNTTRLLILGAVRIFQPTHGYFLRRELMTWRADEWASLNPGSVYNALRSLEREGFLEQADDGGGEAAGPARTTYRLTADGETEFLVLLREALWNVHPYDPAVLLVALSFMCTMPRDQVIAALEHRVRQIEGFHQRITFDVDTIVAQPDKPPEVAEHFHVIDARLQGELRWTRELVERLRGGAYTFAGETLTGSSSQV